MAGQLIDNGSNRSNGKQQLIEVLATKVTPQHQKLLEETSGQ